MHASSVSGVKNIHPQRVRGAQKLNHLSVTEIAEEVEGISACLGVTLVDLFLSDEFRVGIVRNMSLQHSHLVELRCFQDGIGIRRRVGLSF